MLSTLMMSALAGQPRRLRTRHRSCCFCRKDMLLQKDMAGAFRQQHCDESRCRAASTSQLQRVDLESPAVTTTLVDTPAAATGAVVPGRLSSPCTSGQQWWPAACTSPCSALVLQSMP